MISRIIVEPFACSGAWNMAVDEALLESAAAGDFCTLRVYEWESATVSLGYFQSADDPSLEERFPGLAKVRRLSGGGAILHHHEVTYSITIADGHPLAVSPGVLYEQVHQRVIEWLATVGVPARLRGEPRHFAVEPFLCFGRGDVRDIVCHGAKIMGSAQRRRRGAVLQHGALLLARSDYAPEFPGIAELAGVALDRAFVATGLKHCLSSLLPGSLEESNLTEREAVQANQLALSRYSNVGQEANVD